VSADQTGPGQATIRIDKWLWFARLFKSRSLAAKLCAGNRVRVNRRVVAKSSASIRVGDVLTFPQGSGIRVVKILALGTRRGPAPEAATLYDDLTPQPSPQDAPEPRQVRGGRPTKAGRRAIVRLKEGPDPES
jgi:ribosome-associated heat shock protein Hsp15